MFAGDVTLASVFVVAVAAARITRLITTDDLTDPIRLWIAETYQSDWVDKLFSCDWCMGFWVSLFAVVFHLNFPTNPILTLIFLSLAVSEAVGMLADAQAALSDVAENGA